MDVPVLEPVSRAIADQRRLHRPVVMARTAAGDVDPESGLRTLDAMRWVDRAVYHVWRATHHLGPAGSAKTESFEIFEDAPSAT